MDPEVVDIAKKWFGYKEDSQNKSIIADGLDFMSSEIEQGLCCFICTLFLYNNNLISRRALKLFGNYDKLSFPKNFTRRS